MKELGGVRRRHKAEKYHATEPAVRRAKELDVDLGDLDGSGTDGEITVRDVEKAADKQ